MGLYVNLKETVLQPTVQLELIQTAAKGKLDWIVSGRNRLRIYDTNEVDDFFTAMNTRTVSCGIVYLPYDGMAAFEGDPRYLELLNNCSTLNLAIDDAIIIVAS